MEEYYIGMLNLPMFTGPDDTSVAISAICFFSAYMGAGEWWMEPVEVPFGISDFFGIEKSLTRITYAIFLVYWVEISMVMLGSIHKYWSSRNESHFVNRFNWYSFAMHGGYMFLNVLIYDVYGIICGSDILTSHTRSVTFCFAGQFLQAVLRMIVANASGEYFNPYRRTTLIAWGLMTVNILAFMTLGEALINEQWLFRGINVMIWSAIAHFAYHVLNELKQILGIRIFHVTPKKQSSVHSSSRRVSTESSQLSHKKK